MSIIRRLICSAKKQTKKNRQVECPVGPKQTLVDTLFFFLLKEVTIVTNKVAVKEPYQ